MKLCIIIPVYNKKPKSWEILSLQQLAKKCPGKYDICFIYPESWKDTEISIYDDIIYNTDTQRLNLMHSGFKDAYFDSTISYSSLLKNKDFYNRFNEFNYILIYQTDCWALDLSKLDEWMEKGFDYVGSPIIANKNHWPSMPCCGNGGLSLRKVSSFIKYTSDDDLRKKLDENDVWRQYEDVYFCEGVSQFLYIDMPTWEECAEFAYDMNPDILHLIHKLPLPQVGIHAWPKNIPFWKSRLDVPENIVKDCMKANWQFIEVYYRTYREQHPTAAKMMKE